MAYADGNIVIGTSVDMYGMNTGLYKIQRSIRRLQTLLGLGVFAKFGKSAIDAASDLQEVQNIVDVSFGDMAYKIEEFSETSIEKFGMSELSAKQTAGSFTAMGKAIGFSLNQATDMSVTLTGLSGDFASFYNISQDYARVALSAVYTGETETLKRYGIILTEANLQEYAATKGITEKVHAMSAMDKAQLRYNYILEQTRDIQGDFVRTQDSWANQTRVLQQVWNKFLIELGKGLIGVLTPLVGILNSIIIALTRFIVVVRDALFFIFGISLQDAEKTTGKIEENTEGAADSMNDLAGGAKKAAKEARKTIAPFDEINRLVDNTAANLGGGGAADLPMFELPDGDGGILKQLEDAVKNEAWDLYGLGLWISTKIADGLNSIDWDVVYSRLMFAGMALAQFLNGLFQPETFESVARTIANSLNAAIKGAFIFSKSFDWVQIGTAIAASINSFFENFDFAQLAETLNSWVHNLTLALKTALANLDLKTIMSGIFELVSNLDFSTVATIVGFKLIKKLPILFGLLKHGIFKYLRNLDFSKLGSVFKGLFSKIYALMQPLLRLLVTGITKLFPLIVPALSKILGFISKISSLVGPILPALASIGSAVGGVILSITNFFSMLTEGFSWLKEILMVVGIALVAIGAIIAGVAAWPAVIVAAIVAAIATIVVVVKDNWEVIKEWALNAWESIKDWFSKIIEWIVEKYEIVKTSIKNAIQTVKTWIANAIAWVINKYVELKTKTEEIFNSVKLWIKTNVIDPVAEFFKNLGDTIIQVFRNAKQAIVNIWQTITSWFSGSIIEPLKQAFSNFFSFLRGGIVGAANAMIGGVENAVNLIISAINKVISGFNRVAVGAVKLFGGSWSGIPQLGGVHLPRIPALANGAVIPPNAPFMAQLGDQKHGRNLEAPENLIREIVKQESGVEILKQILQAILNSSSKEVILDGDKIGQFVDKYQRDLLRSGG